LTVPVVLSRSVRVYVSFSPTEVGLIELLGQVRELLREDRDLTGREFGEVIEATREHREGRSEGLAFLTPVLGHR
jgi:hypothetical protein